MKPSSFASWLAPYFTRLVELKRSGGRSYASAQQLLAHFDAFIAGRRPKPPLRRVEMLDYLVSLDRLSARAKANVICVVWPALEFAIRHGARIEPLPVRPPTPSKWLQLRRPRIVSAMELAQILAAARRLPTRSGGGKLRSATVATLIGLLGATGIRIGEALALDIEDVLLREGLLVIKRGKFCKARTLPLRPSTVRALEQYVTHPFRPASVAGSPLFVSGWRRRLSHPAALTSIRRACALAEIASPWPRLHDLRHSFTVGRVLAWYDRGSDFDILLPALSTYLGHVSIEHTRTYLTENGLLLERASERFAAMTRALDEARL